MRRTLLAISAAAALLAGACGSSDHDATAHNVSSSTSVTTVAPSTTTTPTTAPAPTTTSAPTTTLPDTSVVPDKITVAYVDAVLAKLNHVYGNAVRSTVAARKLTPAATADIDSIYPTSLAATERGIFREDVREGLVDVRARPGDQVTKVLRIISADKTCVFLSVRTTYKSVLVHVRPLPADEYMGLKRKNSSASPNQTAWVIFYDLVFGDPTHVSDQCNA